LGREIVEKIIERGGGLPASVAGDHRAEQGDPFPDGREILGLRRVVGDDLAPVTQISQHLARSLVNSGHVMLLSRKS
jgi:hypothetical protein